MHAFTPHTGRHGNRTRSTQSCRVASIRKHFSSVLPPPGFPRLLRLSRLRYGLVSSEGSHAKGNTGSTHRLRHKFFKTRGPRETHDCRVWIPLARHVRGDLLQCVRRAGSTQSPSTRLLQEFRPRQLRFPDYYVRTLREPIWGFYFWGILE